jgi:drug/metabolite transporter (DMT)-like permease
MPTSPAARRRLAWCLFLLAPAMWSANMIGARWAADWFPPHQLALWRWLVAVVPMLALSGAALWRGRAALRREWRDLLILGALGMWICGAFVYIGAQSTTATNIGLIYAGSPVLMILVAAAVYGERLTGVQAFGAALALAGVLAIITRGDPGVLAGLTFAVGDLWILTAATSWAVYSLLLRHRPTALDPATRLLAITLGGILVLAPFCVAEAATRGLPPLEWRSVAIVLLLGLVPGFGAYQAYSWLLREIGTARTGLLLYLIPVYNAALAWLILGEGVRWYHAAGAALVLAGVWLANRKPPAKAQAAAG